MNMTPRQQKVLNKLNEPLGDTMQQTGHYFAGERTGPDGSQVFEYSSLHGESSIEVKIKND